VFWTGGKACQISPRANGVTVNRVNGGSQVKKKLEFKLPRGGKGG